MKVISTILSQDSDRSQYVKDLLWAACCVGFFSFLRAGEFTLTPRTDSFPVQVADVAVNSHTSPSMVCILLCKIKTDLFGHGAYIYSGKTHKLLCPVVAIVRFLAIRSHHIPATNMGGRLSPHTRSIRHRD